MPYEITINSIDDLQPSLISVLQNIDEPISFSVPAGSLDIVIRLKGESWDGMVDIRIAKFVCELQSALDRFRRHCDLDRGDKPLVKLRVDKGSTELHTDVLQFLKDLTSNMTSGETLALALSVLGVGLAGWTVRQILDHLKEVEKMRIEAKKSTDQIETLQQAIARIDPERAPRKLVAAMQESDTIQMKVDADPLARESAKERYPRKRRIAPSEVKIDDNFLVDTILLETPPRLTLCRGGLEFKADMSMHIKSEDKDAFLAKIRTALDAGTSFRVPLHIDARVGDRIHSATIVGIGNSPREGAVSIEDILD